MRPRVRVVGRSLTPDGSQPLASRLSAATPPVPEISQPPSTPEGSQRYDPSGFDGGDARRNGVSEGRGRRPQQFSHALRASGTCHRAALRASGAPRGRPSFLRDVPPALRRPTGRNPGGIPAISPGARMRPGVCFVPRGRAAGPLWDVPRGQGREEPFGSAWRVLEVVPAGNGFTARAREAPGRIRPGYSPSACPH
jgi:hypothetical protein